MENGKDLRVELTGQSNNLFLDVVAPEKSKFNDREKKNIIEQIREGIPDRLKKIEREMDREGPHSPRERLYRLLVEIYSQMLSDAFVSPLLGRSLFFTPPGHHHAIRDGMKQTHYLPAIRGGIMQSHRTLVSALIEPCPYGRAQRPIFPRSALYRCVVRLLCPNLSTLQINLDDHGISRYSQLLMISSMQTGDGKFRRPEERWKPVSCTGK